MSTTLLNCMVALNKDIGDFWSSTTTGAGSDVTTVDTALMAKANDWITDETWIMLEEEPAGNAAIWDERKVSSLDNTTGTLTNLAFAAAPGTGIDYSLHRLFKPSDKRIALINAAKDIFPHCFKEIQDESLVSGNWLKDGSFEIWTTATNLSYWTETTVTVTRTSTAGLVKHGNYSAALSTAAGNLARTATNDDELLRLAAKTVTFTVQGSCSTASCLRIGIYDGTTTTYSSYIDQNTAWTKDNAPLTVTATIQDHPNYVTFYIYHDVAAGTGYVDDARVVTTENPDLYIGNLGLVQNKPHQIWVEPYNYYRGSDWERVRDWVVHSSTGYLSIPDSVTKNRNLRIRGLGYLNFYTSAYTQADSTDWTATIAIDEPQVQILSAAAALRLYTRMSMPNYESGTRKDYQEMIGFWKAELAERKAKFGMPSPSTTRSWGIS